MKRLKLFKESFDQDGYYQKISKEEYYREFHLLHELFSEKEIQKITKMARKYGYLCWNSNRSECISLRCKGKPFLYICKFTDDWYYVKTYIDNCDNWYKCDQFDGLEKFISDIK